MRTARIQRVSVLCVLLGCLMASGAAQDRTQTSPAKTSRAPKESFLDFTLKRVNPGNQDYGQCISEARRLVISETMKNAYFWSNVTALGLLAGCFGLILYQRKMCLHQHFNAVEALCQFENALGRADSQIDVATKRNHELMLVLTASKEAAPLRATARSQTPPPPQPGPRENAPTAAAPVGNTAATSSASSNSTQPRKPSTAAPQLGLFSPDVDHIATINALQQQLIRCQERVKNLTRQLNEAERRVQEEQQKNRSLKGQ